ncbi:hypothetical protein [Vibrio agarivorans]|uniref:hypothetical protein n=1 Tax=Vibrio agarivorans TaxID=153622 RepID=UPI002232C14D|nr:hypothetical protein [Vibrio agarivorans]
MVNTLNDNKQHLIIYLVMASLIAVVLVQITRLSIEEDVAQILSAKSEKLTKLSKLYMSLEAMVEDLSQQNIVLTAPVSTTSLPFPIIQNTQAFVDELRFVDSAGSLPWVVDLDDQRLAIELKFDHRYNWFAVMAYSFLISGLLMVAVRRFLYSLPTQDVTSTDSMSVSVLNGAEEFIDLGLSHRDIDTLGIDLLALSSQQKRWFKWALSRSLDAQQALMVAKAEDSLHFDLDTKQILVRGIPIALPKTPFFYYYWYASRKHNGEGFYTNPAASKPDLSAGVELAKIMERNEGIARTVDELSHTGLRSKHLDLNRNKLKDALTKELGELAEDYLFVSERDHKVARYRYMLALDENSIHL